MNIHPFFTTTCYKELGIDNFRKNNVYTILNANVVGRNTYYPNCLIYDQQALYNPYDEKIMSLNKTGFYDGNIYDGKIDKEQKREYSDVYFFIYNFDNYYHFIYDTLPYLINFFEIKKNIPGLMLLINYPNKNNKFYQFNMDIFDLLNINYILHEDNTLYKKIYISNSLTHGGYSNDPPHHLVYEFFNTITKNVICNKLSTYNKIYISRRTWTKKSNDNIGTNYTTRRKMINEDAIVDSLKNEGYIELFAEDYSLKEKINIFVNATHIIGAIGGGMCNLLFSPKTTKVLCIVSPDFLNVNYRFKYSMDHTNIKYFYDCLLGTKPKIPLYTRVQIIDDTSKYYNKIGEVVNAENEKYTINISNNDIAGFNNDFVYDTYDFMLKQLKQLDKGLNSPYYVDETKFIEMRHTYDF